MNGNTESSTPIPGGNEGRGNHQIFEVLESIQDGFFAVDSDWRFTYINRLAAGTLGFEPEALIGANLWQKFPRVVGTAYEAHFRAARTELRPQQFETKAVVSDRWYDIRVYPSADGISVYWQDVSERKKAEVELNRLKEKLELQVAQLNSIILSIPNALTVYDRSGRIIMTNQNSDNFFKYSEAEKSQPISERTPKMEFFDIQGQPVKSENLPVRRALNGEKLIQEILYVTREDSEPQWISSRAAPILVDGVLEGAVATVTDITRPRRIEDALRESEERFFKAFRLSPVSIVIATFPERRWVDVNDSFLRLTEFTREEVIGRTSAEMKLFPETNERTQAWRVLLEKGKLQNDEMTLRTRTGRFITVLSSIEKINIQGKEHIIISSIDITDRKRAEADLARLNRELQAISECSKAIVRSTDEQALFKDVCRIMCETADYRMAWVGVVEHDEAKSIRPLASFGDDSGYVDGARITWADTELGRGPTGTAARTASTDFFQDFATEPRAAPWSDRALSLGFRSSIAIPLFDSRGSVFAVFSLYSTEANSFTPAEVRLLEELAGDLAFGVGALRTNQERVKAEESLRQYAAELEVSNKELETFAYSVSHDLRGPLRSLDGFSQAVMEDYAGKLDKTGQNYLKRIREAAQRMSQITEDMLKLSRVVRSELHRNTVNLSEMAASIMDELKETQPERLAEFIIAPGIGVKGDKSLLQVALLNLLENAWKFTSRGTFTRIEFGVTRTDGKECYFVKDNGAGFDMQYAAKLFQPFQRLHSYAEYPGTGIGLAIVQRVIRRHGGQIWAHSEIGKGTTLFFTLG